MGMILTFDRAKEASAVYDAAYVPDFESFMSSFKAVHIVSTDPLVIETWSDLYYLDAEYAVSDWWPFYDQGQASWHALTLGLMVEERGEAAFSQAKAGEGEVEWLSYISGPTLEFLRTSLTQATEENYIPYAPTLGEYVSADDATDRWANLTEWNRSRGHFWVGTGAYFLQRAFPVEGNVILQRNPDFPDNANKWDRFSAPAIAEVDIEGPNRVTIGEEAAFDVFVSFEDAPYAVDDIMEVKYLVFDATGTLAEVGVATAVEDGLWEVTLSSELTGKLAAGSNRLEVVVVSKRVALPSSNALQFVTAN
jgi:peptide/nickel transport system substrate-binding protein